MFDIGYPELLLIALVALLLFGAKRVPEVAKALGQSIHAFKSGLREGSSEPKKSEIEEGPSPENRT